VVVGHFAKAGGSAAICPTNNYMPPKPTANTAIDTIDSSKNADPMITGSSQFPRDLTTSKDVNIRMTAGGTIHSRSICILLRKTAAAARTYIESNSAVGIVILV